MTEDLDLTQFLTAGTPPLPPAAEQGWLEHDGAQIWYAVCGKGPAVVLLHGGLGHSGNWSYLASMLVEAGYRVVLIDSRGHGRSTRDEQPYSYERMAADVLAVMDNIALKKASFIGWSDGACTALIFAAHHPERTAGVFFFACNMDPTGTKEFHATPEIERCFSRHRQDYLALSATPDCFEDFVAAVSKMMSSQPNYSPNDLQKIEVPVEVVLGEHDEFIKPEHATYLAATLPNATLTMIPGVSHFAPLQKPEVFNAQVLKFLQKYSAN
ncbi:alpha/beta fold hydrolase [Scandinavium sp. NPDC088450]|uniref:alpha/beta fold hydrolase n=1 Tax=Scandinavium sp. NPDC088450 TaxID=3364514 RepID=UPI00384E111D